MRTYLAVLLILVMEEEDVLGHALDGWIVFDNVVVLKTRVKGVAVRSRGKAEHQAKMYKKTPPNQRRNARTHTPLHVNLGHLQLRCQAFHEGHVEAEEGSTPLVVHGEGVVSEVRTQL
jgi:hypothetical protein